MDLTSLSYIKLGIYYDASPRFTLQTEILLKQWGDRTLLMKVQGSIPDECCFHVPFKLL